MLYLPIRTLAAANPDWSVILKNWKTSLGGLLLAVPPLIIGAGFPISPNLLHWLALCQGLGALLLGTSAVDSRSAKARERATDADKRADDSRPAQQ